MTDDKLSALRAIYAEEAAEHLSTLNQTLLALETNRDPAEQRRQIEVLGRAAHSLKGASRAVGMNTVETVAHRMESVFDAVQNGTLEMSPSIADALYDTLDTIQAILDDEPVELEALIETLDSFKTDKSAKDGTSELSRSLATVSGVPALSPIASQPEHPEPALSGTKTAATEHEPMGPRADESIRVSLTKLDELTADASDLLVERGSIEQRLTDVKALRKSHARWQKEWRQVRTAFIRAVRSASAGGEWPALLEFLNQTQRYMRLSGQQLQLLDRSLTGDSLRLNLIADSLQDSIRRVRLVPFELHAALLQRTVRDVAREEGKEVLFQMTGVSLELDRRVLEAIKDPLIHLLRNAVDHGIESPAERTANGKMAEGTIILAVSQRGGEMTIFVADDGAGIDVGAVRARARTILSESEVNAMTDSEAAMLIMLPGLSTSSQITTISGRGIGLDVVREKVEALQGRITIDSQRGQGTTFRLTLPVSLSTLRCMLVRIGTETYAIPTAAIEKITRISPRESFTSAGHPMITVDGRTVGLQTLADVIGRPGGADPVYAVVLASAERRGAFLIDDLITESDMVVKSLNPELAATQFLSGATLLGTGEAVIILNVSDILKASQSAYTRRLEPIALPAIAKPTAYRILIVDDSITTRTLEKNILEAAGYEVITATNGMEALDILSMNPCDLVVSDVEMPYMDGFELTTRIRRSEQFGTLPVILVTSLDSTEHRERGLQTGANHYVVKGGFNQGELLQVIRQLL